MYSESPNELIKDCLVTCFKKVMNQLILISSQTSATVFPF